jgi:hypothetical protein
MRRSTIAVAAMSSPKISPQALNGLLLVTMAGAFIAAGDEHEHQAGGLGVERDVADLVTDKEGDPLEPAQLVIEPALALRVAQRGDPFGRGAEQHALTGQAGADPHCDREMGLAGPGGRSRITLSLACRKSSCPRCSITCFLTERWKVKSNSSSVLWAGNLCREQRLDEPLIAPFLGAGAFCELSERAGGGGGSVGGTV